jgi:hypothetical protein
VSADGSIELFWLPLGAGGHCVKHNGRVYEAIVAWRERRPRADLYHSALEVRTDGTRYAIEMTPVRRNAPAGRGVVVVGDVGARGAGRIALFRYEVHCWRDGVIPDVAEAVDSPRRLSEDADCVARILDVLPQLPTPVWGLDELRAGEMWNSNSVISWLLARADLAPEQIRPPAHGRAPGWDAGVRVARRGCLRTQ